MSVFPDAPGAVDAVPWPSAGKAKYWLGYGVLAPGQTETWGLHTIDDSKTPLLQWKKQAYLTTDELRERLAVKTGAVVARALVQAMADGHPELFTDTATPSRDW